jgi:PAS domain S-box-containing protein
MVIPLCTLCSEMFNRGSWGLVGGGEGKTEAARGSQTSPCFVRADYPLETLAFAVSETQDYPTCHAEELMELPLWHVLLVQGREDDSIRVRNLLTDITSMALKVNWVSTYEAALRALTQDHYDVCLLDYHIDAHTGLDLLQDVPTKKRPPIILLAGAENQAIEAAAVSAGAADYLLKEQLTALLLERSIRYAMERSKREVMLAEYADTLRTELRQSQLLLTAVGNFTDGLLITDAQRDDNPIIFANPAFSTLTGYTSEEILGRNCRFLQGDGTDPQTVQQMREAIKEQRPFKGVVRNYRKDGTPFWNGIKIVPVFDAQGQLSNFVGLQSDITERRQAEIALQESEANLARAQQITRLGSWELDLSDLSDINSNPLRWSDETFRLIGFEPREIEVTNENFFRSVHPDDRDRVAAAMARAVRGEQPYNLDHRVIWPDGTEHVIHGQADLIRDTVSGVPLKVVGTGQDITERKQAETLALESQQRLALATESARIGIWDWDVVADKLVWDAQMYALYGRREQDFSGAFEAWLSGLHPDDRERATADVNAALEGTENYHSQFRVLWPNGEVRHLEAHGEVQRAEDGSAQRIIGVNWDVTERWHSAEALRLSINRFEVLSRATNDAIWDWNLLTGELWWNEGFETLFGYNREAIEPGIESWKRRIHPDDLRRVSQSVHALVESGGQAWSDEYGFRRADGSYATVFDRGFVIRDDAQHPVRMVGSMQDITERKKTEEALQQANDELELHVMERTAELEAANEALRIENIEHQMTMAALRGAADAFQQAKEEAESANAAKSEFLSRMSHELRTPLNAILGFGQILEMRKQNLDSKQQEGIQHIVKAGQHLLGLINEVLDISRVEAGHSEMSIEPVALNDVIPEACDLVRPLAAQRNIRLDHAISQGHVLADRQRLLQVLLNLLSNGIKYNRPYGEVVVSCERVPDQLIRIGVRDTGPGIETANLPKLFTPFERLGAADSGVEGTGLGLVLSQRLVAAMGGSMEVESTVGQGSTFFIELPSAISPVETLEELPRSDLGEGSGEVAGRQCSVLCIEDNLSNLRLFEVILEDRPEVTLLSAMQGSVGLDLAHQHRPDLILLDLHLPDIHGQEVLARLRQSEETANIPVIVISADATARQIQQVKEAGVLAYLTKPLNVAEFMRLLDEVLQSEDEQAPGADQNKESSTQGLLVATSVLMNGRESWKQEPKRR